MCRWALALLVACSSKSADPPPLPSSTKVVVPAHATDVKHQDVEVGLRDSRTITTFCLAKEHRSELSGLPCQAPCVWRKLHTEIAIEVDDRPKELFVTVIESEYDNCLFEGCAKPGP